MILVWPDGSAPRRLAVPSDVWVLRIDADGRVAELEFGEIPGVVGSESRGSAPAHPSAEDDISIPIHSAGGTTAVVYRFSYDDVPPITAPDR